MTQDALIQAILEEPEDDSPRLIYADWLEENGQPQRAEFIRIQIALAQGQDSLEELMYLRKREADLLRDHAQEWLAPFRALEAQATFSRGFVNHLVLRAGVFSSHASRLLSLAPLRGVRLTHLGEYATRIGSLPELKKIRELDLSENYAHTRHLEALLRSEYLTSLIRLNLRGNAIRSRSLMVLLAVIPFRELRTFNLASNELGNGGAILLAESPQLARLECLNLERNGIGAEGGLALAESPFLSGLQLFHFNGNFAARSWPQLWGRFGNRIVM